MNIKNIKYYIAVIIPLFSISIPAKAMTLNYFSKDIVVVFNDASLFLLGIVGRIALLFIIYGGVYYIFSGSDPKKQESAKKTITYALLGLMLVLLSYAILAAIEKIGTV